MFHLMEIILGFRRVRARISLVVTEIFMRGLNDELLLIGLNYRNIRIHPKKFTMIQPCLWVKLLFLEAFKFKM